MSIVKLCAFCFVTIILILTVKEQNKTIATLISIIAGASILIYCLSNIAPVFDILSDLSSKANVQSKYLALILKVAGIAYLVEFGKNVCVDSGESALGTKLELAGKLMIVTLTIPILSEILELILGLA